METTEFDIYIGKLLNNRYLVKSLIGKGSMSRVYLAEDTAKGNTAVAVKILGFNFINQQMSQRFAREIFVSTQLGRKSKHIVRILSYGVTEEKIPFYIMEYLEGKSLKVLLKEQHLSVSKFLDLCYQIGLGLQCAHQGINLKGEIYPIVHRDIKSENIFITENAKKELVVKILDFGIAKFLTESSEEITLTDSFIDSLPYCSSEYIEGHRLIDVHADIYSLGVLMFEMLTDKHPFQTKTNSFSSCYKSHLLETTPEFKSPKLEETISRVEIPQELKKLVMKCLSQEINHRPRNINEVLSSIEKIQFNLNKRVSTSNEPTKCSSSTEKLKLTSISARYCLQKEWPKNKPVAPICFPKIINISQENVPTFWAMLPKQELEIFLDKTHSTEFISNMDLCPVFLWITVLYDVNSKMTRWLPHFLDMKDSREQSLVQKLVDTGYYHLLFFTLEEPNRCSHVMTVNLTAYQRQQLVDWLEISQKSPTPFLMKKSKKKFKSQYEKIKPEILQNVASNYSYQSRQLDLKAWSSKLFYGVLNFFSHPLKSA
jgi:serine/threonine-protein kinase